MEKVAILNDIHGNLYLLNKALDYLRDKEISKYLICGDFLTDGPDDNKIIDTLKSLPAEIILGNREEYLINLDPHPAVLNDKLQPFYYTYKNLTKENLEFLKHLPITKTINIANKKICMSHGSPYQARDIIAKNSTNRFSNMIKDYPADIFVFAHTHEYFNTTFNNKLFLNTGAISCFIGKSNTSTFGILTITSTITSYEQIILPINFKEVKDYYFNSKYYKEFPEWSTIILYMIKDGINYNVKFSKSYDYNKSMKVNFNRFKFIYNLPTIK